MGDPHPDKSLVFYKYRGERERWVSHEWLREQRLRANRSNRKHYNKEKAYYIEKAQARRGRTKNILLSDFHKNEIKKIYARAQDNHVDHIFPLIHPCFCGLHVPWNLQHLGARENMSKSNRVEDKYYSILGDVTLRFEKKGLWFFLFFLFTRKKEVRLFSEKRGGTRADAPPLFPIVKMCWEIEETLPPACSVFSWVAFFDNGWGVS